ISKPQPHNVNVVTQPSKYQHSSVPTKIQEPLKQINNLLLQPQQFPHHPSTQTSHGLPQSQPGSLMLSHAQSQPSHPKFRTGSVPADIQPPTLITARRESEKHAAPSRLVERRASLPGGK